MNVLTCLCCDYERSSEDDGKGFIELSSGDLVCTECAEDLEVTP